MVDTIGESINNGLQICQLPGMSHPCLLTSNNDAKIRLLALPSLDVISQYTVAGAVNYCAWTLAARVQIGRALATLTELLVGCYRLVCHHQRALARTDSSWCRWATRPRSTCSTCEGRGSSASTPPTVRDCNLTESALQR